MIKQTFKPTTTMSMQTRQSSLSSALRISKHKATVKTIVNDPDAMFLTWPRDSFGLNATLNWMLNKHDVTPSNEAYRNLTHRSLLGRTTGKVGTVFRYRKI
jgi:hypothetical protein